MSKAAKKTVWITRTQPSANESAKAFEIAGYEAVVAPLLTVKTKAVEDAVPDNAALIFTSQNGVRAFCESENRRDLPVVTVGDATAKLALNMGFSDVRSAGGTSEDIAALINNAPDGTARYLHISGQHVRGAVSEDLRAMGLTAERRIYYGSSPVQALPDIDIETIDMAIFFSPLAAETLARLAPRAPHMSALSISAATDAALGTLGFRARYIAKAPTLEGLIAALEAAR